MTKAHHAGVFVGALHVSPILERDEGVIDGDIARSLHLGLSTVERTRKRFVEGGLERALTDLPRPGKARLLNGKQEALLVALACSDPPPGRERWTMQLLADRLVELKVVDSITDETVRHVAAAPGRRPARRRPHRASA